MFAGIFGSTSTQFSLIYTVVAGLSIILAAIYTLNMIRRVFYGETNTLTSTARDISFNEKLALGIVVVLILWMGIYPQPVLDLTQNVSDAIIKKADVRHLLTK